MATPSSRSKGSIRLDARGPTWQRSPLPSQQRFSSSSMTPVPWAACCKQRRYGDRSPASYTSIRSTTFAESLPARPAEQLHPAAQQHRICTAEDFVAKVGEDQLASNFRQYSNRDEQLFESTLRI